MCLIYTKYTSARNTLIGLTFAGEFKDSKANKATAFPQFPGWRLSTGHSAERENV